MKYNPQSLMIVAVGGALLLAVAGGYWFLWEQGEAIHDAYCIDWASAMVIQFMDDNEGKYPGSWSDLRQPLEKLRGGDNSFSFEEIQSRVAIDFSANPGDKKGDDTRPLIWLNSGRRVSWGRPEPNERIWARIA
jgi:hypothetical protein